MKTDSRIYERQFFSSLIEVDKICAEAKLWLKGKGLEKMAFDVDLLLREFLNNAVVHGNLSNPQKNVRVQLQLGFFWLKIVVEDEGKGFPWRKRLNFKPKPTETTGRGLIIGVQYSHRIRFNRQGNHVSLWLKIKK